MGPALITHPNGAVTPSEEPAVLAARADHFAAKGHALNAAIASGPGLPIAPVAAATPLVSGKTFNEPNFVLNLNNYSRNLLTFSVIKILKHAPKLLSKGCFFM